MADVQEISTVSDFTENVQEYLARVKASPEPVVLTESGQPEFVVQTAASYEAMLNRLDELEFVEAVQAGEDDIQTSRLRPAAEAFRDLRARLGL